MYLTWHFSAMNTSAYVSTVASDHKISADVWKMWFIIGMVTLLCCWWKVWKRNCLNMRQKKKQRKESSFSYFLSLTGTKSNALPKEYIVIREKKEVWFCLFCSLCFWLMHMSADCFPAWELGLATGIPNILLLPQVFMCRAELQPNWVLCTPTAYWMRAGQTHHCLS